MSAETIFGRLAAGLESAVTFSPAQNATRQMLENGTRHTCIVGGTRSGKTFTTVREIVATARRAPRSRHAMLRFRANAARSSLSLDTLPNVVRKCFAGMALQEHRQDGFFELENGSQIWIGGLDDKDRVEKILGQEYLTLFLNEASQIPYSSFLVAMTRLAQTIPGEVQRCFVDLNPTTKTHWTNMLFGEKRDPISRRPLPNPADYQRVFLNPRDNETNLSPAYLASLAAMPERQRKRFYEGVYVEEVEGAIFKIDLIEKLRVDHAEIPEFVRVVVAIDPAVSADESSNETGIIVAALGEDGHGYVLEDGSGKFAPATWARQAVALYHRYSADRIVAEINQGGALVENTIFVTNNLVAFKGVHASRGKVTRAEPIAALYERGKVHHVGVFPDLEEQMTTYELGSRNSPDRMDALVWALTELMVSVGQYSGHAFYEMARAELALWRTDPPEPIRPEFAQGSVEWVAQQARM